MNQPQFFFEDTSRLLLSIDLFSKFEQEFLKRTRMPIDEFNELVTSVKKSPEYKKGRNTLKENKQNTAENMHKLLINLIELEYKKIIHKNDCCKIC